MEYENNKQEDKLDKGDENMRTGVSLSPNKKLTCLSDAKKIIQKTIRENNLTETQIRKSFGLKKYEQK